MSDDEGETTNDEAAAGAVSGEEKTTAGPRRQAGGGMAATARRYGPFVAIAVVIVAVVAVLGGGGDDGGSDTDGDTASSGSFAYEDLVLEGPMTPVRAEMEGDDPSSIDFGPACDPETGRVRLPTIYAGPCVEPFDGDNGGATSQGVTEDAIKIVIYRANPELDPIGAGLVAGAGADLSPEAAIETMEGYADIFSSVYETYGREVQIETYTGTGPGEDVEAARNDAIAIAQMEPFAVLGGPSQTSLTFADELAENGIISFPPQPLPDSFLEERFPYVYGLTTPNQAAELAAEMIGNLAGPGPAEMAGDPDLREEDRVYALVRYNTPDGDHDEAAEALRTGLSDRGIEITEDVEFILDTARLQEQARTIMTRLKNAGVTTIIFYGDPLTPSALTAEATDQDYQPEWILGPSLLADTAFFGRTFDQEQWSNGFGIALAGTAGAQEASSAYTLYTWAFGEDPPSNIYGTLEPGMHALFGGIHLAGPELTPETFRDGMFRRPPAGGGPTRTLVSRGDHGIWDQLDYGSNDDAAVIWWDPEAEGKDETGAEGQGLYRFANGGERYVTGEMPESPEEAGLFDDESSVVEILPEDMPEEDRAPDYPSPDLD